jgi:hypothetical protein
MRASVVVFCVPKAGNGVEEGEDAAFPARSCAWSGATLRAAVADGASEALLSGAWAALLVRLYGRRPAAGAPAGLLALAAARWARGLRGYLRRRPRRGRPVQWYEEPGLAAGAFAAFAGLTLHDGGAAGGAGRWQALALGDSCLFQLRDGMVLASFPVQRAAELGVRPLLLGSHPDGHARVRAALRQAAGEWRAGDIFYLMTDALAGWWLAEQAAGGAPWRGLDRVCRHGRRRVFAAWVAVRRRRRALRNDDVALVRIELRPGDEEACGDQASGAALQGPRVAETRLSTGGPLLPDA